ncbi:MULTISPECIES: methyltransferase [Streptomyces]|uniref:Ribosomal RNA large subunit methyltransferase G n=3 Tax=Streptomyces griseus TaxID=1911 RepID=RLMG_STRGG|nr:methyltransferase [Streptomyces griseus]B1VMX8.1 RecName: Full=Ribosomal RNA large subunit methyltransferase G; AltName: Full=23S rRNA m2G1835 methyltransferase; AltName: Full=rRNA (guanine-N(2)-)-methyltransferase RlmG [Streptomyces griseus subsp. griseus NBRC 13350]BAG23603.1 putative ribosomal RNA small subunit methyltransferase [Streptomyces griseus subsp. griseus NBRC 13350]SEE30906.1 23S rRNA m(2)G-1835 methyltransferase [Streptomyces griseus]SQA25244.1 ribosomal RNA small subunit meth
MNRFTTSQGAFELARFPEHPRDPFRAWDAADDYLLQQLTDPGTGPVDLSGTVAVVGDRWGALATALAAHRPVQISDSYLARRATLANLARNGIDEDAVRLLSSRDTPPDRIDVLLVRVPKSLAFLEDQLHRLAPAVHSGTVVIGTGMVKEIHTSTLKIFERIIGPTRTSLAVRKARLIFSTPDPALPRTLSPWPYRYELPADVGPVAGLTAVNHAGIFCAERLDIGTRFFLKHLPTRSGAVRVVDLGCGNGVLGLSAAVANPDAHLTFVDESYGAVASAEETFRAGAPAGAKADFLVGDGLADLDPGSVDLVLNNPPFHSHLATTDATARTMFAGAKTALRRGGELWVVGNRHLSYHTHLRRIFGNCTTVAGDPKFVVLRAVKR